MAGNYKIGSGVPKTKDSPGVGAGLNLSRFAKPKAKSTSNAVNSETYQPFPGPRAVAGASGPMSAGNTHSFDKLNSPVKQALGARAMKASGHGGKAGPSRLYGTKGATNSGKTNTSGSGY